MKRHLSFVIFFGAMILGTFISTSEAALAGVFPITYDSQIRKSAEQWLPGVPWLLLKAELWQESRLNPSAVNPKSNAQGIAQFMDPTWAEVTREMKWGAISSTMAGPAIQGAAYYLHKLKLPPLPWSSSLELERHRFAVASY